MGLRCTCGLIIPNLPSTNNPNAVVFFDPVTQTFSIVALGTVTLDVNVCDRDLQGSFVTINFEQISPPPVRNFTFNSTQIFSVTCTTNEFGQCVIEVSGSGQVEGETETRQFTIGLIQAEGLPEVLSFFNISNFALADTIALPSDEVTTFGCF